MTEGSFKFDLPMHHKSIIKVIGVGGGGSNAVNHMHNQGITGVEFIVCNTDSQALNVSAIPNKLQIGVNLTEGLGAGANPEKGKNAALENKEEIRNMLNEDTRMVFITAGMGGGTGTGAAPVIAQVAKELGILTVGIVTVPFKFEGKKKMRQAMAGVESLKNNCDTVLVILNDKLLETFGNLSLNQAFAQADNVLTTAAKGIAEIITVPGYVNVDFEDVKTVMKDSGGAVMGSSETSGENRAIRAIEEAINSPLLNNQNIKGADKILLSIISGDQAELKMDELTEITDFMQDIAGDEAEVIFGHGVDSSLGDGIRVTIIATGFDQSTAQEPEIAEIPVQNTVAPQPTPTPDPVPTPREEPSADSDIDKKIYELDRDTQPQIELFSNEFNTKTREEKFEEEFKLKMKSFQFEKPEQREEPEVFHRSFTPSSEEKDEQFELEMRSLFMESQKKRNYEIEDEPLEELDGMAHPPSRKIQLMEQSEQRRQKLNGLHDSTEQVDTSSFKEKFDVPAYQRKKIDLKNVPMSSESFVSKYNLNEDQQLGGNKFLHDNVD
ncbi:MULTISPECIES: cell division protein FtsZ [Reichenbachiella]|uniref:Cell division protein FtsZ n=1 Tax=Reichenbachiella agariperforans TaxID=156994 RepID=A0A1M6LJF0_REIAG|nr:MULTISPECIES: cell division protein FtsZ [Reichenbachiella]RJE74143.1 cell division protein FtsZ [Reichenbachiella sp. MSK19-1]SHJ71304.1 cell division protein FtsZ [Reichenbachiella agariperforans]